MSTEPPVPTLSIPTSLASSASQPNTPRAEPPRRWRRWLQWALLLLAIAIMFIRIEPPPLTPLQMGAQVAIETTHRFLVFMFAPCDVLASIHGLGDPVGLALASVLQSSPSFCDTLRHELGAPVFHNSVQDRCVQLAHIDMPQGAISAAWAIIVLWMPILAMILGD